MSKESSGFRSAAEVQADLDRLSNKPREGTLPRFHISENTRAGSRPPQQNSVISDEAPAGHWRRIFAAVIDGSFFNFIFGMGFMIGAFPFVGGTFSKQSIVMSLLMNPSRMVSALLVGVLVGGVAYWAVNGWFYFNHGGGPGKCLLGLAVRDNESGEFIGWNRSAFRESIGKFLSFLPFGIGIFLGLFRQDRRMIHDFVATTRVVNVMPELSGARIVSTFVAIAFILGVGIVQNTAKHEVADAISAVNPKVLTSPSPELAPISPSATAAEPAPIAADDPMSPALLSFKAGELTKTISLCDESLKLTPGLRKAEWLKGEAQRISAITDETQRKGQILKALDFYSFMYAH